jgi:hypothetical protein
MPEKVSKIHSTRPSDVRSAAAEEQPVILYCLACGHSRQVHAWTLASLLGAAPFGMIIGNLRCKSCRDKVGVVLPWQAPTPRAWAQVNRVDGRARSNPPMPALMPEGGYHYQLETWNEAGGIERSLALIDILPVGHAAFDAAVAHYPKAKITLRAKAQVIRDSVRAAVKPVE